MPTFVVQANFGGFLSKNYANQYFKATNAMHSGLDEPKIGRLLNEDILIIKRVVPIVKLDEKHHIYNISLS